MTFTRKSGLHYAWIILAAACVLSIVARADSASFAVLVDPLVDKFNWKRGDISLAYSIAFLASMPAMLAFGWLGDRYGARIAFRLRAATRRHRNEFSIAMRRRALATVAEAVNP